MGAIILIVICLFLAIGIPFISLKDVKYKEGHNLQCTKCFHVCDIYENEFNSFRSFGKLYVKCPKCRKYSAVKFIKKE